MVNIKDIREGDVVHLRAVVESATPDRDGDLEFTVKRGDGINPWVFAYQSEIVHHEPAPRPQCPSLYSPWPKSLVRCELDAGHDAGEKQCDHTAAAEPTEGFSALRWTTAAEYGRVAQ